MLSPSNRKRGGKGRRARPPQIKNGKKPSFVMNPSTTVSLGQSARPYSMKVVLHSAAYLVHSTQYVDNYGYTIKLNSAWDPMGTYGSETSRFYNEWSAFYKKNCVTKATYKVTCAHSNSTQNPLVFYSVHPTLDTTDHKADTIDDLITFPDTKWGVSKVMVGDKHMTLADTVDCLKWVHVKDYQDNEECCAFLGADPARLVYLELIVKNLDVNQYSCGYTIVELAQEIIFFEPVDPIIQS
jgi:hypothetical protein